MPIKVVHIAGPPGSGKTTLARRLAARRNAGARHHLRLSGRPVAEPCAAQSREGVPTLRLSVPTDELDSSTTTTIDPELVFEKLPAEIQRLHKPKTSTTVFIETDAEPHFRHAYSYDARVFIMPCPTGLSDVFRSRKQAEEAVRRAMHDTRDFAEEIFGLTREARCDPPRDSIKRFDPPPVSERDRDVLAFIDAALGSRLAVQFMLQPCYHVLIDSDVVLLNLGVGPDGDAAEICAHRLQAIFEQLRREGSRPAWFAACEPADADDALSMQALLQIESLIDA